MLTVLGAVIPRDTKTRLNPAHPHFSCIVVGEAEEVATDLRLDRTATSTA